MLVFQVLLEHGEHIVLDALGRLRLGSAQEIFFRKLSDLDARFIETFAQRFTARRGSELRGNQSAANGKARSQQLFDRADTLGDEE